MANSDVYELVVDKNIVASISPGQETEIEIEPGGHKIYYKIASAWVKSNKLVINVKHNEDYIIEARCDIQGLAVSFQQKNLHSNVGTFVCEYCDSKMDRTNLSIMKCPGCGA